MHMGEKIVIELDESTYILVDQNLNTLSGDFCLAKGCKILVTDFAADSISGIMNVDANIKYAEAMVARRLQDDGEFDEPVSVITHWKRKTGKNSTEIFFTAVSSKIYLQYLDKIHEHDDLLIILPFFTVLMDFANQISHKDSIAVVFRHSRFADIIIAGKKRFYHAARRVAFDTSKEQIRELWENIAKEIKTISQEKSIHIEKLISLNWIDAIQDEPFFDYFKIDCFVFNEEPVDADGNVCNISFTTALRRCSPFNGIASHYGKLCYYADKLSISVIAVLVIFICAMSFGFFTYHLKAENLKQSILSKQREIQMLRKTAASLVPAKSDYLSKVKFIDSIFYIKHVPSFRKIINDISSGMYISTIIYDLEIKYTDRTMQAKLGGVINAGFNTAYKDYEMFLASLRADGYFIDKNNFKTEIQRSEFKLIFSWKMR